MSLILLIETSTKNCSVALADGGKLIALKEEVSEKYSHSEKLNYFIKTLFAKHKYDIKDIDAIAISKGPGSYTGLRIGVSTAKGLCYALDIPLIAISTLRAVAYGISQKQVAELYCPMIDARRMEVYNAFYDVANNEIRPVQAEVINENSFQKELKSKVLFFGDGAQKCKEFIKHPNARFIDGIYPSSQYMISIATSKFEDKIFEDIAYFEPYYLKDFVITKKS